MVNNDDTTVSFDSKSSLAPNNGKHLSDEVRLIYLWFGWRSLFSTIMMKMVFKKDDFYLFSNDFE